jgi:hypothetical protein
MADHSYRDQNCLEALFGNLEAIFFESSDIALNSLSNIQDCFLSGAALTNAARQTGALSYPIAFFAWIKNDLAHFYTSLFYRDKYSILQGHEDSRRRLDDRMGIAGNPILWLLICEAITVL